MTDIFDQLSFEESPQGDIFDQIEYSASSPQKEIGRHVGRSVSRAAESLLGLPGDILRTSQLAAKGLETGAGKIREKIGLEPRESEIKKPGIPGSEELKEYSQKLFGDIVVPQSETEKIVDDIVSDASVLALPIKGKIPFAKAIGTAVAANVSKKIAKESGIGEKGQDLTKLGTFFLSGLTGKGNVKKFWTEQYKLADEAIPKNAKVQVFGLDRSLNNIERELSKGISTPSKSFVIKPLEEIQKKIATGEVKVSDLIQMKRDVNELRSKLYSEVPGKQNVKYAQGKINDIAGVLDKEIEKYGKQNPQFLKHYKAGDEAYGGFHQSKKVARWIGKMANRFGKGGLLMLEGLFPKLIPASIATGTGLKAGEFFTRLTRNPTIRKFYFNMIKDAINENKGGFLKNLKSIEKEAQKIEPDIFDELVSAEKKKTKNNP